MKLTQQIKETLLKIRDKLPPEKQAEFVGRIRERLRGVQVNDLAGYTIAGALVGAVCEILPLDTITGIDDWVEIGAAVGAAVGYVANTREKNATIEQVIAEEVQRVLAETH